MIKLTKDMFGCFKDDEYNEVTIEIGSMNPKDVSDTILENQKLRELVEEQITKKMENYEHGYYLIELQSLLEESKK